MAKQETTAESDKLMDRLPRPVRWMFEIIGMLTALGTLLSWLASTFSMFSRMTFWDDAWAAISTWAIQAPEWAMTALNALGQGAHALIELYRGVTYPVFEWITSRLPFEAPTWSLDVVLIALFGMIGVRRAFELHERGIDVSEQPIRAAIASGLLAPIVFVQTLPMFLVRGLLNAVSAIWDDNEPDRNSLAWWPLALVYLLVMIPVMCTVAAAFPISVFAIEAVYLLFTGR